MTDWLTLGAVGCIIGACVMGFFGVRELIAHIRWQRFLKLLDERLGDRADGSRLTPPDDLKLSHFGTQFITGAKQDHV